MKRITNIANETIKLIKENNPNLLKIEFTLSMDRQTFTEEELGKKILEQLEAEYIRGFADGEKQKAINCGE